MKNDADVKVKCPVCGKWLLNASPKANGGIEVYCKRCKQPRKIDLPPKSGSA